MRSKTLVGKRNNDIICGNTTCPYSNIKRINKCGVMTINGAKYCPDFVSVIHVDFDNDLWVIE
jgi:hypothetical protein